LIDWFGGFPTKDDAYYVPRIFTEYLETQGRSPDPTLWDRLNARRREDGRRELNDIVPANIVFLGVWDTVLALGSRFLAGGGTTRKEKQFHTPAEPPSNVQHVRHAIAIDEARHDFQPEVFRQDTSHPSLEQRWFAGVHSNVGGGLKTDGLANCALSWMVEEAMSVGLDVRQSFLKFFRRFPQDVASSKSAGFKIADTVFRPIRGFNGVRNLVDPNGMTLDKSVIDRLNADPKKHKTLDKDYRPKNLLQYLAVHTEYDNQLDAGVLAAVKQSRSG
jgi:hypothetical protein